MSTKTLDLQLVDLAEETNTTVATAEQGQRQKPRKIVRLLGDLLAESVFLSANEDHRAMARLFGYRDVIQHPSEIALLKPFQVLVMDLNIVLFDDKAAAIRIAVENARRGVRVGGYSYYLDDPDLDELRTKPNVVLAKTHRKVLIELGK